jgi:uncharacterized protein (TIGR02453 family)
LPKPRKKPEPRTVSETSGGFRGFGSQALPFLRALQENNERDWFHENKATFLEECDAPLRELVAEVAGRLASKGIDLAPSPRNPVFRIYRDVRFSKDKSPYKTNVGAALYREGDKTRPGLLYIHVQPGESFVASGIYQPDADQLKLIRLAIVEDPKAFGEVIRKLENAGLALGSGDPLARMPKGFEDHAESPFAEVIRYRSFVVSRPMLDEDLERRDLPEFITRFAAEALPLLEFFWVRL